MSQQINLYRPIFRKQSKVFSALALAQALGLMVLAIAVAYTYLTMRTDVLEIEARQSGQRLKGELERLKILAGGETPAEREKVLAERRKILQVTLDARTQALDALESGALGHAEGPASQLRALARLSLDGVWLTRIQFGESSGDILIGGRALQPELVARYVERLRSDPAFASQEWSGLEIKRSAAPDKTGAAAAASVDFTVSSGEREPAK